MRVSTDRPDVARALPRGIDSVPTPRQGLPSARGGASVASASPPTTGLLTVGDVRANEAPLHRSRAVVVAGVLLTLVAVVAVLVGLRIVFPAQPQPAHADGVLVAPDEDVVEQPGGAVGFGETYTYADGLSFTVLTPRAYEPSARAAGGDGGAAVRIEVDVRNRTGREFRPNTLQVVATTPDGHPVEAVWDPEQGVDLTGPDVSIPHGGSLQFSLAFAVDVSQGLALQVVPALYGYGQLAIAAS